MKDLKIALAPRHLLRFCLCLMFESQRCCRKQEFSKGPTEADLLYVKGPTQVYTRIAAVCCTLGPWGMLSISGYSYVRWAEVTGNLQSETQGSNCLKVNLIYLHMFLEKLDHTFNEWLRLIFHSANLNPIFVGNLVKSLSFDFKLELRYH